MFFQGLFSLSLRIERKTFQEHLSTISLRKINLKKSHMRILEKKIKRNMYKKTNINNNPCKDNEQCYTIPITFCVFFSLIIILLLLLRLIRSSSSFKTIRETAKRNRTKNHR